MPGGDYGVAIDALARPRTARGAPLAMVVSPTVNPTRHARCGMLSRTITIMLRWVRRIVFFLLLGAIVNVAVAWGCAVNAAKQICRWERYLNPRDKELLAIEVRSLTGYRHVSAAIILDTEVLDTRYRLLQRYDGQSWWPPQTLRHDRTTAAHFAAGWPLLSLRGWQTPDPGQQFRFELTESRVRWGVDLNDQPLNGTFGRPVPLLLPLRPIWIGFAANAALYGALAATLVLLPGQLRALVRHHRRLCPTCAYPRGASPVCTECGETLPAVAVK